MNKIILALDVDSWERAKELVDLLYPKIRIFKVGSELFTRVGPKIIEMICSKGAKVFLDLKFYDIPNTVRRVSRAAAHQGVSFFTVHTMGGMEMMRAAVEGAGEVSGKRPVILGVTVLTSSSSETLASIGIEREVSAEVLFLGAMAKDAGLGGVVASAEEADVLRKKLGNEFLIVTPGIRLVSDKRDDQKRVTTPEEAFKSGADYIVLGRPIIEAEDPAAVVESLSR